MEISLKDVFAIIKKHCIFILVTASVLALCSFFVTKFFIPKEYTSQVKLYVETNTEDTNSYNALNSVNYAKSLVPTYIQMLQTNNFFEDVSSELDEKYSSNELYKKITFKSIEDTEVFTAVVVDKSPTEAKLIADAVSVVAPRVITEINDKSNLKIVDSAYVPSSPSSPDTTKNVILAFFAGLIISLVIVFVREFTDIKIKYNDEMTDVLGVPVLAAVPDFKNIVSEKKKSHKRR